MHTPSLPEFPYSLSKMPYIHSRFFLELSALIDCTRKSRHLHIHGRSPCEKHVSQTSGGATIWKFIPIAPLYTVAKAHMLRMRKEILRRMTAHVVVPREKGYITLWFAPQGDRMEKIMNRDEVEKWEKKSQSETIRSSWLLPHGFFQKKKIK